MSAEGSVFDTLKYRIEVDEYGDRRYYNALGQLHREDGPAITWANGGKSWILNGVCVSEYEFNALRRAIQNGRARHI